VPDRSGLRRSSKAAIPAQRQPGIELVDARTRITHRVTSDELLAGRLAGNYEALCGARLLSASLTDPGRRRCPELLPMTTSGRSPVERTPSEAPGGRSAPPDPDLAAEVAALAELLAEVVHLAGQRAVFPGHSEQIAEQAMEHESVRAALAEGLS
jgi:hypothetical protein